MVDPPGWPSTGHGSGYRDARYKWFLDIDGNGFYQGGSAYNSEYLLLVEDSQGSLDDNEDGVGEIYLLQEWANDTSSPGEKYDEYESGHPPVYSSYQVTDSNIASFRIAGPSDKCVDMYVAWSALGDPSLSNLKLFFATDSENSNLDSAPSVDKPDKEEYIPLLDMSVDKDVFPETQTVGGSVVFTILVNNTGEAPLNVTVTDLVPDGMTPAVANATENVNGTWTIIWALRNMLPSTNQEITFTAVVDEIYIDESDVDIGDELVNFVEAKGSFSTLDGSTSDSDTATVTVASAPVNSPPVADADGPYNGVEGSPVTFDGSGSYDPDAGDTLTYLWNFGDGIGTSTDQNPTYTYSDDGVFTVSLTVSDGSASDSDTTSATVSDLGPTASFTSNSPKNEGDTMQFTDTSTSSPDTITSRSWNFGDTGSSTAQSPTHVYADDGVYTVTLTVTDDDGSTDSFSANVTVNNVDPTANAGGPYNGNEGSSISFSGTASDPVDSLTYEWDFNYDGVTFDVDASGTLTPSNTYNDDGTYTAALRVSDDGTSTIDNATVTVIDLGPTADAGSNQTVDEGDTVNFDGSGSSSYPDAIASYEWDFDDGDTGTGETPSHVYTDDDVYTVTLTVEDNDGSTDTDTVTITVNNVAPTITSSPVITATQDALYNYDVDATDPGSDDILTYSLVTAPENMTINVSTGLISWTPTNAQVWIVNDVSVRVDDDDGGFDGQNFTINVTNVNDPPYISQGLPDVSFPEDTALPGAFDLDNYFADPDLTDSLTYYHSGNANVFVTINGDGTVDFSAATDWNGFELVTFTASDGQYNATDEINVTVTPVNDAPVVGDIPDFVIDFIGQGYIEAVYDTGIDLDDYVSDVDNADSELTWTYTGNTNIQVYIDGDNMLSLEAPQGWTGTETITFTATDPGLLSDSNDSDVTAIECVNATLTYITILTDEDSYVQGESATLTVNAFSQCDTSMPGIEITVRVYDPQSTRVFEDTVVTASPVSTTYDIAGDAPTGTYTATAESGILTDDVTFEVTASGGGGGSGGYIPPRKIGDTPATVTVTYVQPPSSTHEGTPHEWPEPVCVDDGICTATEKELGNCKDCLPEEPEAPAPPEPEPGLSPVAGLLTLGDFPWWVLLLLLIPLLVWYLLRFVEVDREVLKTGENEAMVNLTVKNKRRVGSLHGSDIHLKDALPKGVFVSGAYAVSDPKTGKKWQVKPEHVAKEKDGGSASFFVLKDANGKLSELAPQESRKVSYTVKYREPTEVPPVKVESRKGKLEDLEKDKKVKKELGTIKEGLRQHSHSSKKHKLD